MPVDRAMRQRVPYREVHAGECANRSGVRSGSPFVGNNATVAQVRAEKMLRSVKAGLAVNASSQGLRLREVLHRAGVLGVQLLAHVAAVDLQRTRAALHGQRGSDGSRFTE